jgi:hypothetical protein
MVKETKKAKAEREGNKRINEARTALHQARIAAHDAGDVAMEARLSAACDILEHRWISRDEA